MYPKFVRRAMYKQVFGWLTVLLFYSSCSDHSPSISVVCEEDPKAGQGNCIIKWETTPIIEGKVKIYASTNPENIPEKDPVATANIADQLATIAIADPTQRYYYKLVFNNRHRKVTAARNVVIPGIQNFRDIGGYNAMKGKKTRWGMLYRSSQVESLSYSTFKELKNLGIKTVIDLRTAQEVAKTPRLEEQGLKVVHIPIGSINIEDIIRKVCEGKIENDSISRLMLRVNREMVIYYRAEYKKMFDVLEKENYPMMILCMSGMDRAGIASAMILSVLGVNNETIMEDYLLSNMFFDIPHALGEDGYKLPFNAQEALTTLFSAREGFLNAARHQVEKNYGNIPTYLDKGLGLTEENIRDLRGKLLY